MIDRRLTDDQLTAGLRAHLPATARTELRGAIVAGAERAPQQRALPSILGALTDADPITRRRATVLAAAALLAVALAGAAAAGALQLWHFQQPLAGAIGLVAFTRDGDLYVGRPDDSMAAVMVVHLEGRSLEGPRWSADGRWIAVQTEEPSILAFDVQTGQLRRLVGGWLGDWSPVAQSLAYVTADGDLAIYEMDRRASRIVVAAEGEGSARSAYQIDSLRWSPDGRQLVVADVSATDGRPLLLRVDAASGATTVLSTLDTLGEGTDMWGTFVSSWAPGGDRLAYALVADRGFPEHFWVSSADGTDTRKISDPDGIALDPEWSPDGEWLAYRSMAREERGDRLMLVRPDGSDRRVLATDVGGMVGWSPDGRAFAYTVVVPDGQFGNDPRAFHVVSVADGADRVVPSLADSFTYAWWAPTGSATDDPAISLPSPLPTAAADEPHAAPAAAAQVEPDASWGGVAFMRDGGGCPVSSLRFPDDLVAIDTTRGVPTPSPAPTTAVEAGASAAPIASDDYCEVRFAPDGSAFTRSSGARSSFTIFRSDGSASWGPLQGIDTRWSRGSGWLAVLDCEPETCTEATIMRTDGSDRREVPGMPTWSPGDRSLALRTTAGRLLIGDPDGTSLKDVGDLGLPAAWAPDGETFVFLREGDAWLARADGTGVRNLTEFEIGGAHDPSWSPDGRWIAVQQGSTMWLFAPDGATRTRLGTGGGPAWSSDGRWLAFEGGGGTRLVDLADGSIYDLPGAAPAFSADGRHLAVVSGGGGDGSNVVDVMNADGTGRRTVATGVGSTPVVWVSR